MDIHTTICLIIMLTLVFTLRAIFPAKAAASSHSQTAVSADEALQILREGNQRFAADQFSAHTRGSIRRAELLNGQSPHAVIVTCSDSRVPPELLFDQSLGEIFIIRVAGNVLDAIGLGSIEYAVEHLNTKLVVVMGHEQCGAVKAAVDGGHFPPNIMAITDKIKPAVAQAHTLGASNIYEAATNINIHNMVSIIKNTPGLTNITELKVVGAKYHLSSGLVSFLQ